MTLAEALTAERERQGLSLYKLALDAGTSAARVKSILDGETVNPGILTVRAILAAMGKSLAWLEREFKK
jgi:transcriptional regulator with XRE-family HTH domain